MTAITIFGSLFLAALLAATIIPFPSEPLLIGYYVQGTYPAVLLWLVATLGNVLGGCINWGLGYFVGDKLRAKWLDPSKKSVQRAQRYYDTYGLWSILFAWVPLIGDPLTLLAGFMKMRFWQFLPLLCIAKGARYGVVMLFANALGY